MKMCFYSPYIPKHLGGGEKHFFDVALVAARSHSVSIALPPEMLAEKKSIVKKYEAFLGESLSKLEFVASPLFDGGFFEKTLWTAQFDALYLVTDGSLFFSLAKKNYLHVQVPLLLEKSSLLERLKLANWQSKNTNSEFTKKIIEKVWHTKISMVLNPKVNIPSRLPRQKEKIILHVGRFFTQLHSKRQDVLIDIFRELVTRHPGRTKGWKLVLVGQVEDQIYFEQLKKQAAGLRVEFVPNASHQQLMEYYKQASIYWHSTGYEVNEAENPEKVEHFGITTAEAMAYGVVPFVLIKGGQPEVLGSLSRELGWSTKEQCVALTAEVLKDTHALQELSKRVRVEVRRFSEDVFNKKVKELFS